MTTTTAPRETEITPAENRGLSCEARILIGTALLAIAGPLLFLAWSTYSLAAASLGLICLGASMMLASTVFSTAARPVSTGDRT